jgi:hypothetical protein
MDCRIKRGNDEQDCATYSVGEARRGAPAFQSLIPLRSFCLSVSGAVAPSAPDFSGLSRRDRLMSRPPESVDLGGGTMVDARSRKSMCQEVNAIAAACGPRPGRP